ncbi:AMP-binding protein [Phenylobacterium conjunctum]|uniref:AMP-binding protein n=1 Tax=Phenylobacterium conjunctum TaxID=1298959 RepID=A0ABW3T4C2_9CAUL
MSRVLDAVERYARIRPNTVAISGAETDLTWSALAQEVEAAAARLAKLGADMPAGAPVAIALDNGPAWVVLDLALVRLGWPSLPIPGFFTPAQRDHALADAGSGLLITAEGPGLDLAIGQTLLKAQQLDVSPVRLPEGTAKITYTSGSTGQPKGVCLSLAQMEAVAQSLVEVLGEDYAGRHLPLLPLSILLENVAGLYPILLAGGCYRVLPPAVLGLAEPFRPDLPRLIAAIATEGATSLILVPELLRAIMMVMAFTGARFPALNLVAVGGAKVSPQLLAQADQLGLPVYEGYGLSECASVVALNTPQGRKAGAVGRPLPHLQVELDPDGEIIVGPSPFLGYAGRTAHQGPVRTGDIGSFDADGFLRIEGRRGNTIINAFGRNIAPEWVESELTAQPEIRQAIVYGEAQAELSALIVPLSPDMPEAAVAQAVERANQNLPEYAQVRRWRTRAPLDPAAGELTGNGRPRRAAILAATLVEPAE